MKYFKDSKGSIYPDPIESRYTDLVELTKEEFDAYVVIRNTPEPPTAKQVRDAALEALTYDFGDGRVMQTREKDKAKVDTAIELLELSGQPTVDWVMEDDIKYPTTAAELATALLAGKIGAAAIWSSYEP